LRRRIGAVQAMEFRAACSDEILKIYNTIIAE